jgi:organic hydroperoxide reductase OsmC/OhrA
MVEDARKGGYFTEVALRPRVTIAKGGEAAKVRALHESAHQKCFIANSVNFPVGLRARDQRERDASSR